MTPREQKLLASNYTPAVLDKMRKDWSAKEMASALDMRVREIEKIGDLTFLEMGLCVMEFERNERMWQALGYASFPAWMDSGRVKGSRSKRYAALAAVKAMLEIQVPIESAANLTRGALTELAKVPKKRRPEFLDAAQKLEVNALREMIERECPEACTEALSQMRFKPERSARKVIETALEAAILLHGCKTREEALESVCTEWLEVNQEEIEAAVLAQ